MTHYHSIIVQGFDVGDVHCLGGKQFPSKDEARQDLLKILEAGSVAHRRECGADETCPIDQAINTFKQDANTDAVFLGATAFVTQQCEGETVDACKSGFMRDCLPEMIDAFYSQYPEMLLMAAIGQLGKGDTIQEPTDNSHTGMYL